MTRPLGASCKTLSGICRTVLLTETEWIRRQCLARERAEPVKTVSQTHHFADTDNCRRLDFRIPGVFPTLAKRRFQDLLAGQGRIAHDAHRLVHRPSTGYEFAGYRFQVLHRHIHDNDRGTLRDPVPVDGIGCQSGLVMTGQEGHGLIAIPVRCRNAGIGQTAYPRRDARNDPEGHTRLDEAKRFFAAPAKNKRIAPLESQDTFARAGIVNQFERDVALFRAWFAAAFSGVIRYGAGFDPVQDALVDESVIDYDIRLPKTVDRVQGQQTRITGTCARKPHPAGLEIRQAIGHCAVQTDPVHHSCLPGQIGSAKRFHDGKRHEYDILPDRRAMRQNIRYRGLMSKAEPKELRRGWTTGACATAAAKAAYTALVSGTFPDPVEITLPKGGTADFILTRHSLSGTTASAGITKDAGDDPDVTHGALVTSRLRLLPAGSGVHFKAGDGVGTVTRPGLPIPPGEPAINPVPRQMMQAAINEVATLHGSPGDVEIEVSIENGAELALKTMNPRLGIVGGLSVLGTTGIVRPFSCASWIASIHRGVDVARAAGLTHVVGATGSTSEDAVRTRYELDEAAFLDMGDFAGGLLKYLRNHPVERLTLAGGFAKFSKLAQGALDLHSARSSVDFAFLQDLLREADAPSPLVEASGSANTAKEVLDGALAAGVDLANPLAHRTQTAVRAILRDAPVDIEILITDRQGTILGECGFDG